MQKKRKKLTIKRYSHSKMWGWQHHTEKLLFFSSIGKLVSADRKMDGANAVFQLHSKLGNLDYPVGKINLNTTWSRIWHWEQLRQIPVRTCKADFVFQYGRPSDQLQQDVVETCLSASKISVTISITCASINRTNKKWCFSNLWKFEMIVRCVVNNVWASPCWNSYFLNRMLF